MYCTLSATIGYVWIVGHGSLRTREKTEKLRQKGENEDDRLTEPDIVNIGYIMKARSIFVLVILFFPSSLPSTDHIASTTEDPTYPIVALGV